MPDEESNSVSLDAPLGSLSVYAFHKICQIANRPVRIFFLELGGDLLARIGSADSLPFESKRAGLQIGDEGLLLRDERAIANSTVILTDRTAYPRCMSLVDFYHNRNATDATRPAASAAPTGPRSPPGGTLSVLRLTITLERVNSN